MVSGAVVPLIAILKKSVVLGGAFGRRASMGNTVGLGAKIELPNEVKEVDILSASKLVFAQGVANEVDRSLGTGQEQSNIFTPRTRRMVLALSRILHEDHIVFIFKHEAGHWNEPTSLIIILFDFSIESLDIPMPG